MGFLAILSVETVFTKATVTVGVNVHITSGKETGIINASFGFYLSNCGFFVGVSWGLKFIFLWYSLLHFNFNLLFSIVHQILLILGETKQRIKSNMSLLLSFLVEKYGVYSFECCPKNP